MSKDKEDGFGFYYGLLAAEKRLQASLGNATISIPWGDFIVVITQLQLALRHSFNEPVLAEMTRRLIDQLISRTEELDPRLAALLREAGDATQDVPSVG